MVGHVGLLLTRFLSSSASVLVYKIMGFPFFTVVMLGVVLSYKSIVKYIVGLMPHGLALIMEACVIGLAIMVLVQAMLMCLRPGLIHRLAPGLTQGKLTEDRMDISYLFAVYS
jgi:hypothetical protein